MSNDQQSVTDVSASPTPEPLLQVRGLSKSYREGGQARRVFHDLDLDVARAEFVVLMGRSGTGKSTLLNLVSGIDLPDTGQVSVAGHELTRLSERARTLFRRRHIGFVFQFFNLISTLTVEENLLLPLELSGRLEATQRRAARDLLDQVGLAGRAGDFPERLSGGEQQRVAVARALVHRPQLVLADEPTGNLDEETASQVLTLLGRLSREAGMTVLMVTHSSEAAALADRVLALREGRLLERTLHEVAPAVLPRAGDGRD